MTQISDAATTLTAPYRPGEHVARMRSREGPVNAVIRSELRAVHRHAELGIGAEIGRDFRRTGFVHARVSRLQRRIRRLEFILQLLPG